MRKSVIMAGAFIAALTPALAQAQSADVDRIIESYVTQGTYISATSPCSGRALERSGNSLSQYMRKKTNGIAAEVNRGDGYSRVGGKISQTLDAVSFCYKQEDRPVSDKANIASDMARLLVYRLQGKSDFGVNATDLTNARVLTQFAKASGNDMSFEEASLKQFDEPKPVTITAISESVDLNKLAQDFENNMLRVKRDYEAKKIVGEGKVYSINFYDASTSAFGGESHIRLDFDGPKTFLGGGTSGELETALFVGCKIGMGGASEDKAIDLNKGDLVKVTGVVKMSGVSYIAPTLENCEIL